MIVVHHLNNSRSQRVLWLLEELGAEYRVQRYERNSKTMLAPPELLKVHPLGKSPVITDGDVTVAESGAIIEYLTARFGKLAPVAGTKERQRYTYWLHYAEGSIMPLLVMKLVFGHIGAGPMPFFVKPIARSIVRQVDSRFLDPNLALHLRFIEGELGRGEWFAGAEFSAADVQMSFPLEAAAARGGLGAYPRVKAFLERIHARPAYLRALDKGGPYGILSAGKAAA